LSAILLDTHALLWWLEGGTKLSAIARRAIENGDSRIFVSAATAWEIAIKHNTGKLSAPDLIADFKGQLDQEGFQELAIATSHAVRAGIIKSAHKDPFDRMLAAQAQLERLAIVSRDTVFDGFSVKRVW
jgi:PIN domain nuclease of toxin-antitoxin system